MFIVFRWLGNIKKCVGDGSYVLVVCFCFFWLVVLIWMSIYIGMRVVCFGLLCIGCLVFVFLILVLFFCRYRVLLVRI